MIDLHTHTIYSDGEKDVKDLLQEAEMLGLKCLSITDHNNCYAYEALKNMDVAKYFSGKIIPGCELQTIICGIPIELLAYNIDIDVINKLAPEYYESSFKEKNIIETQRLLDTCKKNKLFLDEEKIIYDPEKEYGSVSIHKELTKHEKNRIFFDERSWNDGGHFFRKCISNPNSIFYVNLSDLIPQPDKIIELIKKAGGLVFIPHIFIYHENSNMVLERLINDYDIDGIECFHWIFSEDQNQFLLEFSKNNGYYISGGSDYHGREHIKLGVGKGNLNIPYSIVEDWIDLNTYTI